MKYISKILPLLLLIALTSCEDFLGQVPSDRLTEEQIFSSRKYSERYLAGIYTYIPDDSMTSYNNMDGLSDDIDISYDRPTEGQYFMSLVNMGNWSTTSDYYNKWYSGYRGIRSASNFLAKIGDNEEMIKNGEHVRIKEMKGEAHFLRAYLATTILHMYGPFVIPSDEPIPADTPGSDPIMQAPRASYDECVDYILGELEAAYELLPRHFKDQPANDYGRATGLACLALKSRVLLYAASPQFNGGNPEYAQVTNKDGKRLFPDYDINKWKVAADAAKELIDYAEKNPTKLGLYVDETNTTPVPYLSCRDVFLKPWNKEVIFALTTHDQVNIHRHGSPRNYNGYESVGITQSLVDEFEMANGKRITDPSSGYVEEGFSTSDYVDPSNSAWVFAPAGSYNMYVGREPRFYMNVAFNGAYCIYKNQEEKYRWQLFFNGKDGKSGSWDFPRSGYVRMKGVSPDYNAKNNLQVNIPYVVYRYAEILLNYVEALNEYDYDSNKEEIHKYMNQIRNRAGLPGLTGNYDQDSMREAIRHERRVELCGEKRRYYDTRRWLIAEQTDGGDFYGMNVDGGSADINNVNWTAAAMKPFYKRTVFETRVFRKAYYLFPIPQLEINKDPNIVQNPGW